MPSRNEMFVSNTVRNILENIEADTDIIVTLDGAWDHPKIDPHERVSVIYVPEAIGQRAATNIAARLSDAKYVMKFDAHVAVDKGFDRKMIEAFEKVGDNVTLCPIMRNLWAFDWKCYHCGFKSYQGPTPTECGGCKNPKFRRKIMWIGKHNPQSTSYCFDSGKMAEVGAEKADPHFQYNEAWKHREPYISDRDKTRFTETMSLQGSAFMLTRENYWKWEVSDERLGNWGNQGIEVACATWLSGGRCLVYHDTWYAHLFRTQGGNFSFPWQCSGREAKKTKENVKNKFWYGRHPEQIRPVSWLVSKFWPVSGWTQEDLDALLEFEASATHLKTLKESESK